MVHYASDLILPAAGAHRSSDSVWRKPLPNPVPSRPQSVTAGGPLPERNQYAAITGIRPPAMHYQNIVNQQDVSGLPIEDLLFRRHRFTDMVQHDRADPYPAPNLLPCKQKHNLSGVPVRRSARNLIIVHALADPIKTLIIDDDPTDRAIFNQYLQASEVFDLKPTSCCALRFRIVSRQGAKSQGMQSETGYDGNYKHRGSVPEVSPHYADWRDPHGGRNPDLSDSIEMVESNPKWFRCGHLMDPIRGHSEPA
jgi:hypothetical protein